MTDTPTGILYADPIVAPISVYGKPQGGCYLYFYGTGTTNQTDVYADGYLDTPLTQPVTADANGRFVQIYLDPEAGSYGAYRVQLYTSGGILLEDTDPYVPIPTPSAIVTLTADVNDLEGDVAALQSAYSSLVTAAQYGALSGVPAPLAALGASSPPDSGTTFWNDRGTWVTPNLTGTSVSRSAGTAIALTNSAQTIVASIPVTPGATYSMHCELIIDMSAGSGVLSTQMISDQNQTNTPLVSGGGAVSHYNAPSNARASNAFFGNGTDAGNAAAPGLDTESIFSGYVNAMVLRGTFKVNDSLTTSVSFQMKVASGAPTVAAASFVTLRQIAAPSL